MLGGVHTMTLTIQDLAGKRDLLAPCPLRSRVAGRERSVHEIFVNAERSVHERPSGLWGQ